MAYNYAAAYGASYGQYSAQTATLNTQQQTSATAYPYGQTAATAYGVAAPATTTSTPSAATQGYGTSASATTTAAGAYNYGYNYPYNTGTSNYTASAAQQQANNLQAFQQSWYGNASAAATPTTQQTGSTTQSATPQAAYGQYLQQYQMYQQYANPSNATSAAKPDTQQQKTGWGMYNQMQQQRQQQVTPTQQPAQTANTNDPNKGGWGNYQQQKMGVQQQTGNQQQKSTGVVYRTPMKYTTDTHQYTGSNVGQNYNTNQSYKSPGQNAAQSSYSSPSTNYNQGYGMGSQSYGGKQSMMGGNNMQMRQPSPRQSAPQQNQQYGQRNQSHMSNYGQNQGYQQNQGGQNMGGGNYNMQNNRGGYSGSSPGNMNMRGAQQGGIRPLMSQRGPMGGGNNAGGPGGFGNMGPPRDGPSIPPFPRAWHGQDQTGPRGMKQEPKERWGGPGPRGPTGFNNQQQSPQNRMMYNNNSRNPKGSNRELWSPAQKSGPKPLMPSEAKPTPLMKRDEGEKVDKDKHPEIKSYLYAWLGARHSRPTYDIRQIGERPNMVFRCDLRVDKYNFVGVGKASSKKEAQTMAAWKFAEYLVKIDEIKNDDLPSKQQSGMASEESEGDIGDVNEQNEAPATNAAQRRPRKESDDFRNRNRKGRGGGVGPGPNIRGRGGRRPNPPPPNWGGPPPGPDMPGEIQPLMAVPVGPWGSPPPAPMGPPPPRMMGPPHPHPPLMDYGPPFWDDGWVRPPMSMGPPPMGPPMPMRPPPPFMRRNQNDFWRRRDIEERMMDLSRGGPDWAHPEDMFISQMIRNQQEGERRQRGQRVPPLLDTPSAPGEWERTQQQVRPICTSDDRHVMAKHGEIYPQDDELKHLHRVVHTVEQALKLLSDKFVDEDHPKEEAKKTDEEESKPEDEAKEPEEEADKKEEAEDGMEKGDEKKEETGDEAEKKEEPAKEEKRAKIKILKRPKKIPKLVDTRPRVLCGVNRVGPLSKGLLITKDSRVELVLLCGEIPTVTLLDRIMEHIESKLVEVDSELKLIVERKEEEAGFSVKTKDNDNFVEVFVVLTAMTLRKQQDKKVEKKSDDKEKFDENEKSGDKEKSDENEKSDDKEKSDENENSDDKEKDEEKDGEDESMKENDVEEPQPTEPDPVGMLSKPKMLEALACLRHTHWFQAKACGLQSCVILTRVLRDLQRRDEEWNAISEWALEVLVHSCLSSSEEHMGPGDACRRFFEVVAGGIFLPDMPGINDPCEREQRDVLDCLTGQQREDLTRKAQRYLRNIAFREIYLILGMEKLQPKDNQQLQKFNVKMQEDKKVADEKVSEPNNQRKRRFEANGNDSVAESPKRSLTDEEDTDTQQNLAELSLSDENSEGKLALEEAETEEKAPASKEAESAMDISDSVPELTKEEEDALLEDDEKMDT